MFENLSDRLERSFKILRGEGKISEINIAETVKDIRRALLDADVSYKVAKEFCDRVKAKALGSDVLTAVKPQQMMVKIVHDELVEFMGSEHSEINLKGSPAVILVAGLNGSGKTTFCGKLALRLKSKSGMKVMLAACDTFRPAAVDQLSTLGEQVGVPVYSEPGEKDPVKAAELLGRASALGDPQAASSLGYMLMVGEGVPMDMAEAERQLRRAASGGVTAAMCNLGVILSESDPDESLGWFEKAADLGNLKAVRNLAASYSSGCGARLDKARAAEYYRRAADMGDVDSMCVLASMLRNGDGVPMDKAGAADLYRRAADLGDPDAQYDLAFMLDSGEGIPQDRAEAERLFTLSAEQGDTDACLCIGGILYERGDFAGAEGHFMTAALKGDVKAAYNLGLMYSEGSLGEPDMGKAEEWFESAASEGFAYAQTSLAGILYSRGDLEGAAGWYRKAAEQGEPTAMYNLGAFGVSGMIKMDEREAMDLLVRAASAGVEEARVLLSRITSG